ncbi:MAG: hypothetical protein Kow0089_16680 [Desulfobulbaceae bacterium]
MGGTRERRRHARFRVSEGAFAFIGNVPFTIRNISEGGMKLESAVFDDAPAEEMVLDIFLQHENLYLQDIPVRLVRFQKSGPSTPFSSAHVLCFGLQFGELTQQQKTRLDYFISRSTFHQA